MLTLALLEAAAARGELVRHELAIFEPVAPEALDAMGVAAPAHCRSCRDSACSGAAPGAHCSGCDGDRACPGARRPFVPPELVRLFRFGGNPTEKGVFTLEAGAKRVLEHAAAYGNDFPFDYCHAMVSPPPGCPPDEAGKAAGWFVLELRDDGLYARVKRWTEAARRYLEEGEYCYTSPAFFATKDGTVVAIINCALTNIPATHRLAPLVAHQTPDAEAPRPASTEAPTTGPEVFSMKGILTVLGLAAESTEGEAVAALSKIKVEADARVAEANRSAEAARADVKRVLDAVGAESLDVALPKLAGLKDAAEKGKEAAEKLAKIETEAKAKAEADAKDRIKRALDAGEKPDEKGGVKLTPAGRAALEKTIAENGWSPEGVEAYVASKGYELLAPDTPAAPPGQAGAAAAPGSLASPAAAPPKLLAKFEDYQEGDLWKDLERLAKEQPADFKRLKDDYVVRSRGASF